MVQEQPGGSLQVSRLFEQPPDALSTYSDFAQVMGTGNEVILQFYDTVPDVPGPDGQIQSVRTRLRATVVLSKALAINIGRLLLQHAGADEVPPEASAAPGEADTSTEGGT